MRVEFRLLYKKEYIAMLHMHGMVYKVYFLFSFGGKFGQLFKSLDC